MLFYDVYLTKIPEESKHSGTPCNIPKLCVLEVTPVYFLSCSLRWNSALVLFSEIGI